MILHRVDLAGRVAGRALGVGSHSDQLLEVAMMQADSGVVAFTVTPAEALRFAAALEVFAWDCIDGGNGRGLYVSDRPQGFHFYGGHLRPTERKPEGT